MIFIIAGFSAYRSRSRSWSWQCWSWSWYWSWNFWSWLQDCLYVTWSSITTLVLYLTSFQRC